jgi:membrane protein DedA with SNARE-associated domain
VNLETITNAVLDFVRAHQAYAPLIIGLMTFAESLAFLSLILPMVTILIAVGFVVAATDIPFWHLWLSGTAGASLSAWISFEIGSTVKKRTYGLWPLSRNPDMIAKGERFFHRFGPWALFAGRFFGPTRAVLPLIAGVFMIPRVIFQAANMASASVWTFALLAPGAGLAHYLLW